MIVPRQNGKSWILEIIILYKIFVLHENVIFTAQQWKTAESIYKRCFAIVKARRSLMNRVVRYTCSQGRGTIELDTGGMVVFSTRSADTGRGLDQVDTLIFDEAYNLTEAEVSAIVFTQMASPDPQTIYTSSAVNSDVHQFGQVLTGVRERGMAGSEGLFFAEWMAPKGMPRDLESTWEYANPSYGIIQTRDKLMKTMNSMNTLAGQKAFDVEALGRGDWPVLETAEVEPIINIDDWAKKFDPSPRVVGDSAVGIDASPTGDAVALVSATRTAGGVYHLMIGENDTFDRKAVVDRVDAAVRANDPVAVGLDPDGVAGVLESDLKSREIDPVLMRISRVSAACELFFQLWKDGLITHDGNERFVKALKSAQFRDTARGKALTKKVGDITPLVAATFAVWLLREYEIPMKLPSNYSKKSFAPAPILVAGNDNGGGAYGI